MRLRSALAMPLAAATSVALLAGVARGEGAGPAASIETLDAGLARMEATNGGAAAKAAVLAPAVDASLDLATILQNSVGLSWGQIPPATQQKMLAVFRRFTLANYVSNFTGTDDRFAIVPGTRQTGDDVIVQSSITPQTGDATRIDYVMHQTEAGWRAVDVLVDGTISRVAVQRSDFRSVLESGGADALIASLGHKVTTLSDGQLQP